MRIEFYKETADDWHPPFELVAARDKNLVRVSFLQLGPIVRFPGDMAWRVCVWGADDDGMEIDYPEDKKDDAWDMFVRVMSMPRVNKTQLFALGFGRA